MHTAGTRRSEFLARGALVGGGVLAAGLASGPPGPTSAASADQDRRALELILLVEYTEDAFYAEAIKRGALQGELLRFAKQVAAQEREHVAFVKEALAGRSVPKPDFDFGSATRDPDRFADTAARLEDLAVAGYNGQATNISRPVLEAAAKIVSVEARHAAWIRSISGDSPAPDATDKPMSAGEVLDALSGFGVKR